VSETKFRVYEENLGMLYVTTESDYTLEFGNEKPILHMHCSDGDFDYFHVDNLMQYSGLKDSTGKDIYENDIVYLAGYGDYVAKFPFIELYEAGMEGDIGGIIGYTYEYQDTINPN